VGYLDLSAFGSQCAESANVGMLDLVAALEWVRDNIANFGGDPSNVLIFGQSGGGGKVETLMTMPAAKGLFHKGVVESGSLLMANNQEESAKLAAAVVAELGLSKASIAKIHDVPVQRLIDAGIVAVRKLSPPPSGGCGSRSAGSCGDQRLAGLARKHGESVAPPLDADAHRSLLASCLVSSVTAPAVARYFSEVRPSPWRATSA
jgi:hypothetical protein